MGGCESSIHTEITSTRSWLASTVTHAQQEKGKKSLRKKTNLPETQLESLTGKVESPHYLKQQGSTGKHVRKRMGEVSLMGFCSNSKQKTSSRTRKIEHGFHSPGD